MTLHLPPPSEPVDRENDPSFLQSKGLERCRFCAHEWHGLICRVGTCSCDSAFRDRD